MKKLAATLLTAFVLTLTFAPSPASACPEHSGEHAAGKTCPMGEKCKMGKMGKKCAMGEKCKMHSKHQKAKKMQHAPASAGEHISAECQRQREKCGSQCNTEVGDDDAKWDACFATCSKDCDNSGPSEEESHEAGNKE